MAAVCDRKQLPGRCVARCQPLPDRRVRPPWPQLAGCCVLELGSGTGIGGLTAAAGGADTILTDRPGMMPLLEVNIEVNGLEGHASAVPLEWGDCGDAAIASLPPDRPIDLIIGSDVLYAPEVPATAACDRRARPPRDCRVRPSCNRSATTAGV